MRLRLLLRKIAKAKHHQTNGQKQYYEFLEHVTILGVDYRPKVHILKVYYFISQRIRSGLKGSFSALVSKIAVVIIALGMVISILSYSILEGFKREIRDKIYGLSGHIVVKSLFPAFHPSILSFISQAY
jgi:hypothetical protein